MTDDVNENVQEIRYFWAKALGISGPQWMILMALAEMDQDEGDSVKAVSNVLHVDPSFVTTQSKMLEKKGFIRRRSAADHVRVVQMSLTDKTYKLIASLNSLWPHPARSAEQGTSLGACQAATPFKARQE